jgi:hypothetical protein
MSQFEVVAITLSLILGLSMSHILWSAASAIRARESLELHWIPFGWATWIFLLHVQFFIAARSIDLALDSWTWSWYLNVLLLAVLLFGGGAMILPSEPSQRSGPILEDFAKHGRLSLLPLSAYCLLHVPTSMRLGESPFVLGNLTIIALSLIAGVAFVSHRRTVQVSAVISFGVIMVWAMVFLWARTALA